MTINMKVGTIKVTKVTREPISIGTFLPVLYKKTNTGAIQYWKICTYEDSDHSTGYIMETEYGQVDTDSPQTTFDTIYEGKNEGKANATTPAIQAEKEAKARWEKQKKKGYVETIEAAEKGEVDNIIEGGIEPMLAHTFEKQGHKISYPCYIQPKLDGIRCIAIVKNGKCTLWSRTRKPITSCPHIIKEIERMFEFADIVLDGELYNHEFKDNFEHIVHLVRQEEPDAQCTDVGYYIYDTINGDTFEKRHGYLYKCITIGNSAFDYVRLVDTTLVNENETGYWYDIFKKDGYEGAMLRNVKGLYVNKRSVDLIKIKEFKDEEFEITGIDEGRGKLAGHVGAFVCVTSDGKEFLAKMSGETAKLKEYFENHKLWKGKRLTVKFQGLTGANGVPRFPVGIAIRDYE